MLAGVEVFSPNHLHATHVGRQSCKRRIPYSNKCSRHSKRMAMHDLRAKQSGHSAYQKNMREIIELLRFRHTIHTYLRIQAHVVAKQTVAEKQTW